MALRDRATLGTPNNFITFNDFSRTPIFKVNRRSVTRRDVRDFEGVLPNTMGIADAQTLLGKEYQIIEGKILPKSETEYNDAKRAIRKIASLEVQQQDSQSDDGYVPYKFIEVGSVNKQIFMKVIYVDMPEANSQGLIQPFRLLCKVKYPVIFSQFSKTLNLGVNTINVRGGFSVPTAAPVYIGTSKGTGSALPFVLPVVLGATPSIGSNEITSDGDIATYPTISVYGPISKPRITNVTTGEFIELDVVLSSASDSLVITYDQDTPPSLTMNGANVYSKLTSGSTLFKIVPGNNVITLTGSSIGSGATASINFFDAWPIS